MSAYDAKRTCRFGRSRNDLAEPDIVPVDILRTEFATPVRLIAQPVIDFCTALYELLIKSVDVIDPEIHVPKSGGNSPARNDVFVIVDLFDHYIHVVALQDRERRRFTENFSNENPIASR